MGAMPASCLRAVGRHDDLIPNFAKLTIEVKSVVPEQPPSILLFLPFPAFLLSLTEPFRTLRSARDSLFGYGSTGLGYH